MEDKKIEHLTRKELIKKVKMMERDEEISELIGDKKIKGLLLALVNSGMILSFIYGIDKVEDFNKALPVILLSALGLSADVTGALNISRTNREIRELKYMDLDKDDYEYNVSYSDNDDDFITMTEETKIPKDEEGILLDYYKYQKEQKVKKTKRL